MEPSAGNIWFGCESSHAETLSARGEDRGGFGAGGDQQQLKGEVDEGRAHEEM